MPSGSGNVLKSIHKEDNFDSPQKNTGQHDNWSKHAILEWIQFAVEYGDVDGTVYFRLLWFLVNDQRDAQILFYVFISIYNSLHVSSTPCSSSGETNCINTASGNSNSMLVA